MTDFVTVPFNTKSTDRRRVRLIWAANAPESAVAGEVFDDASILVEDDGRRVARPMSHYMGQAFSPRDLEANRLVVDVPADQPILAATLRSLGYPVAGRHGGRPEEKSTG